MNGKCRKIHKKRILSRIVAEAYYTYQGVSQRSKNFNAVHLFNGEIRAWWSPFPACGLRSVPVPESGQDTGSDYPVFG